jgi:hypothetical protein
MGEYEIIKYCNKDITFRSYSIPDDWEVNYSVNDNHQIWSIRDPYRRNPVQLILYDNTEIETIVDKRYYKKNEMSFKSSDLYHKLPSTEHDTWLESIGIKMGKYETIKCCNEIRTFRSYSIPADWEVEHVFARNCEIWSIRDKYCRGPIDVILKYVNSDRKEYEIVTRVNKEIYKYEICNKEYYS